MNSRVWKELYHVIKQQARKLPRAARPSKYPDALIVAMLFWHTLHDRPQSWACDRANYNSLFRPRQLPSISWFNRRLATPRCQQLRRRVQQFFVDPDATCRIRFVDGRPLPVGACSKDKQACPGRVRGGFARGYKLHALVSQKGSVLRWKVTAMNAGEQIVARDLIADLPVGCIVIGDGNYDATPLYELAAAQGAQFLAPPRRSAGRGHRRHKASRLEAIALWRKDGDAWGRARTQVERAFGWQSSFGGGLSPLPAWVRTLRRVEVWVDVKLAIYHARLKLRQKAA